MDMNLTPPTHSPQRARILEPGNLTIHHAGYRLVDLNQDRQISKQPFWRLYWSPGAGPMAVWASHRHKMRDDRAFLVPPMMTFSRLSRRRFISVHLFFSSTWLLPSHKVTVISLEQATRDLMVHYARALEDHHLQAASRWATALLSASLATLPEPTPATDRGIQNLVATWQGLRPNLLPSNKQAAVALNMSCDGFARRFKSAMGVTPGAWRSRHRLMTAARLLLEGHPLKSVAENCGWSSRSHFSAEFKKTFGLPPGEWQRHSNE